MDNPFSIRSEMGIRKRVFALLLIIFFPLVLLEAHVYFKWFQERKKFEMQANLELARAVAKNFETFLQGIVRDELAVGLALTASPPISDQGRNRLLDTLQAASPAVRSLFWMNADGVVTASSMRSYVGLGLQKRSFFQSALDEQDWAVSGLFVGWSKKKPSFTVSCAMRGGDGELLGVAAAVIEPERLDGVLGIGRAADASVNLIDNQGLLVFCYPPTEQSWAQRKWREHYPVLEEVLAGRDVMVSIESTVTGREHLAAFVPIPSIGWAVACSRAESDVTAAIIQTMTPHMGMTLLMTLVGFTAAVGLSRPITGSILRLRDHAAAFGRGEMTPIVLDGPIELKKFASTLNEMAAAIVSREKALQESESRYRLAMERSQALNRVGEALLSTLDFDEIMKRIVDEGAAMLGSESAAVSLRQEGRWLVSHVRGMPPGLMAHMLKDLNPCVQFSLTSKQPLAVDDTFHEDRLDPGHMQRHNTRSVLVAPLFIRAEAIGLLVFTYHTLTHPFTSGEIDFIRQMANIAGIALSNARLYKELEESNQELNEFGYALTHNLRAPLRAVQNYSTFLMEDVAHLLEGAPRQYLEGLKSAVQQGHDQIEDLETLYRIKQHTVSTEPFALQELFDEMQAIFPDRPGQELVAASTCPELCGERFLLRQILVELIRNGFKFNQAEPKRVEIGCQTAADQNGIEIYVHDNGIGIDPQHQERIFRIFQRLHTASEYEGTGIGLAIVRRAVQKMGGTLRLESDLGQGCRFSIHLPMAVKRGDGVC